MERISLIVSHALLESSVQVMGILYRVVTVTPAISVLKVRHVNGIIPQTLSSPIYLIQFTSDLLCKKMLFFVYNYNLFISSGIDTPRPTTLACSPGHFCPEQSHNETGCPSGYYQAHWKRDYCDECPQGYYCQAIGKDVFFLDLLLKSHTF